MRRMPQTILGKKIILKNNFAPDRQCAVSLFKIRTMKKNYFAAFLFLFSLSTFVQAQQPTAHTNLPIDSRLYDAFDGEYLESLRTGNPFLLQRWNYYLDHSWYLTALPDEKVNPDYPAIRISDPDNINIFLLEKEFQIRSDWEKQIVYRIENSDQVLVLIPGKEFTRRLNEHLGRSH